ncbi:hypothetical protein K435DRAFT_810667 [Dendrothele bispora CBS 962.96]|uniref:Uncharacterized protein n=1 Tax=Dendrothele bispora (strain CBS 962.96) TaxID=1314807 RepID=A0A4S8KUN3_DENBC|nr:hypothetical protein K435DRAFT_810667 [Dendrothele bispora CBS 962.96]
MSRSSSTTKDTPLSYTPSPPSDTSPVATSSGIRLRRDADLLIRHFLPPSPPDRTSSQDEQCRPDDHGKSTNQETDRRTGDALPLPLCIPQISVSIEWDSAFARGYNDQLQSLGISQPTLLNFIDGSNLAIPASPPLRVISLVGRVIGFVGGKKKSKTKAKSNKLSRSVGSALLNSPIPIPLAGPIVRAIADKPVPIPSGESAKGAVLRRQLTVVQELFLSAIDTKRCGGQDEVTRGKSW